MRERRLRELYQDWTGGKRPHPELLKRLAEELMRHDGDLTSAESQIFSKLALALFDKVGLLDRFAFARSVSTHPHVPKAVVARMLEDDHLVASAVIEFAPFSDVELLELLTTRDNDRVQSAIARRRGVSESITEVLVARGRPDVLAALAGNQSARLSQPSLETLCDIAVRQSAMGKALARRADLPPQVSALLKRRLEVRHLVTAELTDDELVEIIAANEREAEEVAIAWRNPLSVGMTDFLIDRGRSRVLLTVAGNIGAKISARGFDLLSSIAAHQPEMDDALARRGDLPPEIARFLHRRIGERLRLRLDHLIARDLARGRRPFVLRQKPA